MVNNYATQTGQKCMLVISGPADTRKPENREYATSVTKLAQNVCQSDNVDIVFLGGIEWQYMPWLYARADIVLAPFENEGFGLPPVEAALMGTPSMISSDPALLETTDGSALVIPRTEMGQASAVEQLQCYLSNGQQAQDVAALSEIARQHYSVGATIEMIKQLTNI